MSIIATTFYDGLAQELIKANSGVINLSGFDELAVIIVPLQLDSSIKFSEVSIGERPSFMRLGQRFDKDFSQAVTIKKGATESPSLEIQVDLRLMKAHGSYDGAVSVSFVKGKKETKEEIAFTLVRPAAVLAPLTKVKVLIESEKLVSADLLSLKEVGSLSILRDLQLSSPEFVGINNNDVISFKPPTVTVPAGGKVSVEYTIQPEVIDSLPLGTTLGRMELSSLELSSPVLIEFEITKKRSKWLIILCIFLGAILGTIVRKYLSPSRELTEARIEGFELLQEMARKLETVTDEIYRPKLQEQKTKLSDLLVKSESGFGLTQPDQLRATTTEILSKFNELLVEFGDKTLEAGRNLNALSILSESSNLSDFFDEKLGRARTEYKQASMSLDNANATGCIRHLAVCEESVRAVLKEFYKNGKLFSDLLAGNSVCPSFADEGLRNAVNIFLSQFEQHLNVEVGEASLSQLNDALVDANDTYKNLSSLIDVLVREIQEQVKAERSENLERTFDIWSRLVIANFESNLGDVRAFVELGKAKDVMEDCWREIKGDEKGLEARLASASSEKKPIDIPYTTGGAMKPHEGMAAVLKNGMNHNLLEIGLVEKARFDWWKLTIIQFVIVSLLMALAAYGSYSPSFTGTTNEMIAIFVFAFGLDITLDSIKVISQRK
ncbi:MAG: hypothetical protein RIE59_04800 [Imperialibacter sp.]